MSDPGSRPVSGADAVPSSDGGRGPVPRRRAIGLSSASPASISAALANALREAGVEVVPGQVQRFAAALQIVRADRRAEVYWAARVTLISGPHDLSTFDRLFAALFDGTLDPAERRGDPNVDRSDLLDLPSVRRPPSRSRGDRLDAPRSVARTTSTQVAATDDDEAPSDDSRVAALAAMSATERLGERDFAGLTAEELAEVQALVDRVRLSTPLRLTRRTRPRAHGRDVDMRRTLRTAGRSGGEPLRIARRERQRRPRRLVLLCDVSGSMEPYTRVFLSLLQGAVTSVRAEAFVFATRLTRVTDDLWGTDPDLALARAAARATDISGGTRLGASLQTFLDEHGRRGMARGAVLMILSDGWTEDADVVAEQMARLGRLCHRIVWVNPRRAAPGYEPLAGGMAAALPHCHAFVSGHTFNRLGELVTAVGGDDRHLRAGRPRPGTTSAPAHVQEGLS